MTEEEDGPKRALAQALADHGYVDGDRDEQYRLIDTHPIIAALASRGYAIVSLGLEGIPAENKRLRHDLGALYSRMRHTHPDAVPCVDAGLAGSEDAASKYLNAFHRLLDITQGEATDEEIEHYRLNADDPTNRLLNWGEWREHLLDQLVTDMRETLMTGMHQPSGV